MELTQDLLRHPRDARARPAHRVRDQVAGRRLDAVLLGRELRADLSGARAARGARASSRARRTRSNGRRRKAYELTRAGERALHDWLTSDEPLHIELRHEGALKFFFSDSLTAEEQLELVRRIARHARALAEQLRAIEPAEAEGKPPAPLLTLEFGIAYQEFLADWCAQAEKRLRKQTSKKEVDRCTS